MVTVNPSPWDTQDFRDSGISILIFSYLLFRPIGSKFYKMDVFPIIDSTEYSFSKEYSTRES